MAEVIIDIWSDYVCPFCYLQVPALKQAVRDLQLQLRWRSYELRPEPAPLLDPRGDYLRQVWDGSVYPMAQREKMVLRLPPIQPRSRKAAEAAEFARAKGRFEQMHLQLFKTFFEDGRNIGELNVLLDVGAASGLYAQDLLGSLQTGEYAPKVLADEKLAKRLNITAVPALVMHYSSQPVEAGILATGTYNFKELEKRLANFKRMPVPR